MNTGTRGIIIRDAKESDLSCLIKLCSNSMEIEDFSGQRYNKEYFKSFMNSHNKLLVVAEMKKVVAGALNAEFDDWARCTYFNNLIVSCKYRGKGIGGMLIRSLEKSSKERGHNRIISLVYEWNANMKGIIEHYGHDPVGRVIIYSKKL